MKITEYKLKRIIDTIADELGSDIKEINLFFKGDDYELVDEGFKYTTRTFDESQPISARSYFYAGITIHIQTSA